MDPLHSFLHLLFIGLIALFPVINPVGSAFIVNPFFARLSRDERRKAVTKITFYAFSICIVALFAGHWILELFGISLPVIQLAGGIMICKMGWEFLSSDKQTDDQTPDASEAGGPTGYHSLEDKLFYPITFPVTTGAGTISVLFTLSAHSEASGTANYLVNTAAIILAILIMCIMVYVFYLKTEPIIHYLGSNGEKIVNRISAFLIFCVGLQIAISGIKVLVKGG